MSQSLKPQSVFITGHGHQPVRIFLNCGKLQNSNVTVIIHPSLLR